MASSNPFRKTVMHPKVAVDTLPPLDSISTTQTHTAPPRTSFREPEPEPDQSTESEPELKGQKQVKRVRVLTPPPLSPDSPEWPAHEPRYQTGSGLGPPASEYDPFEASATDDSDRDSTAAVPYPEPASNRLAAAPLVAGGPPGNPFSRTLKDIEEGGRGKEELDVQKGEEGEVLKAANSVMPPLDVGSFKRLLLTGNSGLDSSQTSSDSQDVASHNTDANKMGSTFDGVSEQNHGSNSNHPNSSKQGTRVIPPPASSNDKKLVPPPPPSSRHGKTIKTEPPKSAQAETEHRPTSSDSKTPPQSYFQSDTDVESTSNGDSSSDASVHEAAAPISAKKPAPAPPPRRGHARTDTKSTVGSSLPPAPSLFKGCDDDLPPSRSSMDSTHRRDSTSGGSGDKPRANIPAPPPPRRPHAAPKQTGAAASPPSVSSSATPQRSNQAPPPPPPPPSSAAEAPSPAAKSGKAPAPPLPPARNPSLARRPPSFHAAGGGTADGGPARKDGAVSAPAPPPPPPPPRRRGSSPGTAAQGGGGGGSSRKSSAASSQVDPGKGVDILADLDALRREVEALRGAAQ